MNETCENNTTASLKNYEQAFIGQTIAYKRVYDLSNLSTPLIDTILI